MLSRVNELQHLSKIVKMIKIPIVIIQCLWFKKLRQNEVIANELQQLKNKRILITQMNINGYT